MSTTQTAPTSDLIERLRKVMALTTSANEHEAAVAAAKLQDLLLRHNLSMADIGTGGVAPAREYLAQRVRVPAAAWREQLVWRVAEHNFCTAVGHPEQSSMTIIGEAHNIEAVKHMVDYLASEVERLGRVTLDRWRHEGEWIRRPRAWLNGFRYGAVSAIAETLRAQRHEQMQDPTSSALVILTDEELEAAKREHFPRLVTGGATRISDSRGYHAGRKAGASIQIRKGIRG